MTLSRCRSNDFAVRSFFEGYSPRSREQSPDNLATRGFSAGSRAGSMLKRPSYSLAPPIAPPVRLSAVEDKVRSTFSKALSERSGLCSARQVYEILRTLSPEVTDRDVDLLWSEVVKDSSGEVHIDQILDWFYAESQGKNVGTLSYLQAELCEPHIRRQPLVVISDPGQDLDDEMVFIMLTHLVDEGFVDLQGVVATLAPAYDRARLCRGTLDLLGMHDVPVGVGTDGGDVDGTHKAAAFDNLAHSYMPPSNSERSMSMEPGRRLLHRIYVEAEPKLLTLVVIASLKDAALFLRDNEKLFVEKTTEVVIMGGVEDFEAGPDRDVTAYLKADTAHNNEFDKTASNFFLNRCQELGVRLVIVTRWAAYAAKMPRATYDDLALSGSSIGRRLCNAQRSSIEHLWRRATAPVGDKRREGLPARCDRGWFINTFCNGRDDPNRGPGEPVWDLVDGFMQYDTIAVLAAVPTLREAHFDPVTVPTRALDGSLTTNLVIGRLKSEPNIVEPADNLVKMMSGGYVKGITINHHFKAQVVLVVQIRHDTHAGTGLAMAMLRTLYEFDTVECVGVVVSPAPPGQSSQTTAEHTQYIRKALDQLGLPFVPTFEAGSETSTEAHLRRLYESALPTGVTLVLTGSFTGVAEFAANDQELFQDKTTRVIIVGGAIIREVESHLPAASDAEGNRHWLEPDPKDQNISLDLKAAKSFFDVAQSLGVPMVIQTSTLAHEARVPRGLFDLLLDDHGGPVGRDLCNMLHDCVKDIWKNGCTAADGKNELEKGLVHGTRVVANFLHGKTPKDASEVWECIESFDLYSPLSLLCGLPSLVKHFLMPTSVVVRSATHLIIGSSPEVPCIKDPVGFQKMLLHGMVYGMRFNTSEFDLPKPPPVHVEVGSGQTTDWIFDPREDALVFMLEATGAPSRSSVISDENKEAKNASNRGSVGVPRVSFCG
mmetsp:Transcript_6060/g.10477  ORF Transcript_6060/g.10477 Transcript_6060/m.10477 type:complete len:941 (+) Transcript_6060:95-2917(+)